MPIYDYVCGVCSERTEVIHGIDAPGPRFCPACGAEGSLRKAMVAPAVHFKGSGWAKKDRSATSRAKARTDGEGASTGADGVGGSGTDAGKGGDKGPATSDATTQASGRESTSSGSKTDAGKGGSSATGSSATGPGKD